MAYNRKYRTANLDRREYHRKYRAENLEKIREYQRRYRAANLEKSREASRKWRAKDPEKAREYSTQKNKIWRAKNPEKRRKAIKKYLINNPEKAKKSERKYRAANPEKIRKKNRKYKKYKRETDPNWKLTQNMRSAMSSALKGREKSSRTMKLVGCTVEELFEHLESCASWEPWMTREKYGVGGWDVDHIIPISKWDENCPLQFVLCWDKSNLQPMEHIANMKKGAQIIYVDFTSPKT